MNVQPHRDLLIADQPTAEEIAALPEQGVVAVLNLRTAGEPEQPLSPEAEGAIVRAAGLDYLHVPIGGAPITDEAVNQVVAFLVPRAGDGKVLLHCRKGGRAAALALLHRARQEDWPADEAIARGAAEGLRVEGNLRMLVENYLSTP